MQDVKKRMDIRYFSSYEQMDMHLKFNSDSVPRIINENLVQVFFSSFFLFFFFFIGCCEEKRSLSRQANPDWLFSVRTEQTDYGTILVRYHVTYIW